MIHVEYEIHLTSKTNARLHWSVASSANKKQREVICMLIEIHMRRLTPRGQPFTVDVVRKVGRRLGRKVVVPTGVKVLSSEWKARLDAGIIVTFKRHAARALDSEDNLREAFKSVKDGVADAWGVRDDSDPRFTWTYAPHQRSESSKISVTIEWKEPAQ